MLLCFNLFLAKRLPLIEGIILFLYIIGFFAVIITLWVVAPKAPSKEVWTEFSNFGGWSSVGAACVVGQVGASSALIVRKDSISDTETRC